MRESRTPTWPLAAVLIAATSVVVGVIWDISWHRTIGRDTFWTPAHMAIYLGGVLAGTSCGWLVLKTTFAGTPESRAGTVSFWGFRGPLGAWLAIWGAFAMITSAPFDNWWHNAYGLDVQVLSPPHVLLALGFTGIQLGALFLALAHQNNEGDRPAFRWGYAYAAGLLVANASIMGFEYIAFPNDMHRGLFYQVSAAAFPILLVATARASRLTWPATTAAAVYMAVTVLMVWVLPLFPATARLAPIYRPVTSMVPPPFPILLVVPAFAVDLILRKTGSGKGRDWLAALGTGLAFVAVLLVVQWEISRYLVSPASENAFFGASRWNYNSLPGRWQYQFWNVDPGENPLTAARLVIAVLLAMLSARIGLWWGNWMARVRR
ncbi:MAG TPA: hypothetical protein VH113_00875 [Gemmatimonadales bacterium]|nr:hypothetical protein [Gemmatimonadales bacterium]